MGDARPRRQHEHTNCDSYGLGSCDDAGVCSSGRRKGGCRRLLWRALRRTLLWCREHRAEVSKEHISSSAPTRPSQVQGQLFAAEEDVKALQARVATIEMSQKQVRVPLALPAPVFAIFLACNVAGGALFGALFVAVSGFEITASMGLFAFAVQVLQHGGSLLHPDVGYQKMLGYGCCDLGYPATAAAIRFVRAFLSEINSNE